MVELKLVEPKLTKEEKQFLQQLQNSINQIVARATQLIFWGKNKPDILSQDMADMMVAVGFKIKDLSSILSNTGAKNEIKRIR